MPFILLLMWSADIAWRTFIRINFISESWSIGLYEKEFDFDPKGFDVEPEKGEVFDQKGDAVVLLKGLVDDF